MFEISTLFIIALILLQAVEVRGEDKGKDDLEKLAGVWTCVSGVNDGKPLPEDIVKQLKLTLTKDRYKTEKGQVLLFDGIYKIDAGQRPKHIDITAPRGRASRQDLQGDLCVGGRDATNVLRRQRSAEGFREQARLRGNSGDVEAGKVNYSTKIGRTPTARGCCQIRRSPAWRSSHADLNRLSTGPARPSNIPSFRLFVLERAD